MLNIKGFLGFFMKKVLITGASSGIGKNIAETLADSGFQVIKTARRKINNQSGYFSADLSDIENVKILYNSIKSSYGSIDILINNAGEYLYSPIDLMKEEDIKRVFNLNFLSHYYLTSLFVSDMKKNKFGRIINISSISGVLGEANASLYSASKSAFYGFSKALALELAQYNITVNSISPGWVDTPLTQEALNKDEKEETLDIIPQKRFVEPVEISNLVKYLISDEAKGITGQNINLCAGLTCGC